MSGGMFFGVPFGREPTPEEIEQMEAKRAREQLEMQSFQHGFQRLFDELDEEQLKHVKTMMHIMVSHTESVLAASWEGMIAQAMRQRFNICITCGVNHDLEFAESEGKNEPPKFHPAADVGPSVNDEPEKPEQPIRKPSSIMEAMAAFSAEHLDDMAKYHLDPIFNEDTMTVEHYACLGINGSIGPCGVTYPSIADRKRREPEHCDGCFQRIRHG